MIKGSSRRRQFSDTRSYLNLSQTSNITQTPTKLNKLHQPGKWNIDKSKRNFQANRDKLNKNTNQFNKSLIVESSNNTQMIHQCGKTKQVCVNCVNKIMANKKAKQKADQVRKQKEYENETIEKQRLLWLQKQKQQVLRIQRSKTLLDSTIENKKIRQRYHKQRQQKKQSQQIKQIQDHYKNQHQLEITRQLFKRNKFNEELKEQVQEQRKRKKQQKQAQKQNFYVEYIDNYKLVEDQNKRNLIQIEYKRGLDQQINQKKEKRKKQKENEIKMDKENSKIFYQHSQTFGHKIYERPYAQQLKNQIEQKKQYQRQKQMREKQKWDKINNQIQNDLKRKQNNDIQVKGKAIQNYLFDLQNQIQMNRNRRIKDKQMQKQAYYEVKYQQSVREYDLEDCENCHHKFPKKYLSIMEID